jgi:hypothetical protein
MKTYYLATLDVNSFFRREKRGRKINCTSVDENASGAGLPDGFF